MNNTMEYTNTVEVAKPEPEQTEKKGKGLEQMIGERWIVWLFKSAAKHSRRFLDFYTPLEHERSRKEAICRYVPSAEQFPDTQAFEHFNTMIDITLTNLISYIPWEVLPIIAEELEFITAQYEKQAIEADPGYKMV